MKKWLLALLMCVSISPAYAFFYRESEKAVKVVDLPDIEMLEVSGKFGKEYIDVGYCYKQLEFMFIPLLNWKERYCGYIDFYTYSAVGKQDLLEISKLLGVDTSWDDGKSKISMWERVWGKVVFALLILIPAGISVLHNRLSR